MNRTYILLSLLLLLGVGYLLYLKPYSIKQRANTSDNPDSISDKEIAVQKAKELYSKLKSEGKDLSSGPCISEDLVPDWVADVAHNPRIASDNLPENQCQSYREGKAHHFVELDTEGNLIRAM